MTLSEVKWLPTRTKKSLWITWYVALPMPDLWKCTLTLMGRIFGRKSTLPKNSEQKHLKVGAFKTFLPFLFRMLSFFKVRRPAASLEGGSNKSLSPRKMSNISPLEAIFIESHTHPRKINCWNSLKKTMVIWFRGLSLFSSFGVIAIITANRHLHFTEPGQISPIIL